MARIVATGSLDQRPEWSDCCWPKCDGLAEGGGGPLCAQHHRESAMAWMLEHGLRTIFDRLPNAEPGGLTIAEMRDLRDKRLASQVQVYYLRIGDHVKIGYSNNIRSRVTQLRVDLANLLATEPGGRALEQQRHKEFAAERVGRRENFNPSPRLLAHIEAVLAEHGPPKITDYRSGSTEEAS